MFPKLKIEPFSFVHDFQVRLYLQFVEIVEKTDLGKQTVESLKNDPRVVELGDKMISRGSGAQKFEVETLAMWFLWCANEFDHDTATQRLEQFLNSEKITVINVLWILGIDVQEPIDLVDGFTIQPVKEMPDSRDKEHFLQHRIGNSVRPTPTPKSAIIKHCAVRKALSSDPSPTHELDEFWNASRRLHEIAILLNALEGVSSLPYYSTSYPEPTTPFGPFGGSGGGSVVYDVLGFTSTHLESDIRGTIIKLLTGFDKLAEPERARMQRILSRLSQAKRRTQIEDKILDLGIALEMMLLDDNRSNEQLSLSFRLRRSWLLGNSPDERKEVYRQLKRLYRYRSQVAHGGVLCRGNAEKIRSVQSSLPTFQNYAEQICQKLIVSGIPKWDGLILNAI